MKTKAFKPAPFVLYLILLSTTLIFGNPVSAAANPVWVWGQNTYGQLGYSLTLFATEPIQVTGLTGVTAVRAGRTHNLALKSDGTVWAWGNNGSGQLGDGTSTFPSNQSTPVQTKALTGVLDIAAGAGVNHSLAVKSDGTVWAWGSNSNGQLGDGTAVGTRSTPVQVGGLTG